jgi:hypothetical protein
VCTALPSGEREAPAFIKFLSALKIEKSRELPLVNFIFGTLLLRRPFIGMRTLCFTTPLFSFE